MLSQQLIISFRPMQALRQTFISKRPVASFLTASLAGGISYAFFIEQKANTKVSSSSLSAGGGITSIPREYDRDAIADYWKQRPISVVSRIGMIGYEFIPLLSNYIIDFKIFNHKNNDLDRQQETYISHAAKLRQALTNLGPAFIKFGQQISIRPDLLPAPVLKELQKLCDAVEPIPDHIAMQTLMQEIGQETLDKCLLHPSSKMELVAAASLGQVYKATLKSGQNVALKIQRPDMIQKVSLDLFLLNQYGLLLDTIFEVLTNQIPFHVNFIDCFARASFEELDYEKEAKNQLFFRKEFEKRKCQVHIPLVFDQLTTRRVICSEWIDGVKLADAGQDTIRRLIPVGVELFMTQLLDIGAFHADPQ
jgi:aarF domain-containing kinase